MLQPVHENHNGIFGVWHRQQICRVHRFAFLNIGKSAKFFWCSTVYIGLMLTVRVCLNIQSNSFLWLGFDSLSKSLFWYELESVGVKTFPISNGLPVVLGCATTASPRGRRNWLEQNLKEIISSCLEIFNLIKKLNNSISYIRT